MAKPITDDAEQQLDAFIDKLIEEKDNLPPAQLDEAFWKDLERHPFFLKEMPEEGAELHPATEALQALKWEDDDDTPIDRAQKYKDEGNKLYEYKKYRNAIINYTEGIKQRCSDPALNAILFCNRATAQFYLGNYRSAIRDCILSRKCKPDHIKAYVKAAESAMKLEKFKEALTWANAGLTVDKNHQKLAEIRDVAPKRQKEKERDERKQRNREQKTKSEEDKVIQALKERKIRIQNDPSCDIFDRNAIPTGTTIQWNEQEQFLTFPVVFLYPEFGQADYVKEFHQNTKIVEELSVIFNSPAPWDQEGKYRLETIGLFYEDRDQHKLKQISPDLTLLELLQKPGYVVQVGMASLIVMIPKSSFAEHYLSMFETL